MFQFPSTIPTVTTVLLLTLTTILTVASNREIYTGSYKSLAPGYSYRYLQEPPTEQFSSTRCLLKCVAISLSSQSEFFTYNNVSRVCKNYSPKNIMTVVSTNDSNEMSFYRSKPSDEYPKGDKRDRSKSTWKISTETEEVSGGYTWGKL
ncbi:Hypothetical predicted protein [Octopus vulgaris]|uniref:Uncharacterized protein n=1 Tax=Octopus vulgaris TaxID=6645 RepID=A0AA36FLP2_OCTVU|nr:Hypothetical predicted protein [Octopus vulgaris]